MRQEGKSRPTMSEQAKAYLEQLVRDRLHRLRMVADPDVRRSADRLLDEVNGAVSALLTVGSIAREDATAALNHLYTGLTDQGLIDPTLLEKVDAAIPTPASKSAGITRHQKITEHRNQLQRVIPVGDSFATTEVIVLSLEIWSEFLVLRFASLSRPPLAWSIADDLGTTYSMIGGSGGGRGQLVTGETWFAPAPPLDARQITLMTRHSPTGAASRMSVNL